MQCTRIFLLTEIVQRIAREGGYTTATSRSSRQFNNIYNNNNTTTYPSISSSTTTTSIFNNNSLPFSSFSTNVCGVDTQVTNNSNNNKDPLILTMGTNSVKNRVAAETVTSLASSINVKQVSRMFDSNTCVSPISKDKINSSVGLLNSNSKIDSGNIADINNRNCLEETTEESLVSDSNQESLSQVLIQAPNKVGHDTDEYSTFKLEQVPTSNKDDLCCLTVLEKIRMIESSQNELLESSQNDSINSINLSCEADVKKNLGTKIIEPSRRNSLCANSETCYDLVEKGENNICESSEHVSAGSISSCLLDDDAPNADTSLLKSSTNDAPRLISNEFSNIMKLPSAKKEPREHSIFNALPIYPIVGPLLSTDLHISDSSLSEKPKKPFSGSRFTDFLNNTKNSLSGDTSNNVHLLSYKSTPVLAHGISEPYLLSERTHGSSDALSTVPSNRFNTGSLRIRKDKPSRNTVLGNHSLARKYSSNEASAFTRQPSISGASCAEQTGQFYSSLPRKNSNNLDASSASTCRERATSSAVLHHIIPHSLYPSPRPLRRGSSAESLPPSSHSITSPCLSHGVVQSQSPSIMVPPRMLSNAPPINISVSCNSRPISHLHTGGSGYTYASQPDLFSTLHTSESDYDANIILTKKVSCVLIDARNRGGRICGCDVQGLYNME